MEAAVPEKGAPPKVKPLQRKVLDAVRAFTSPLLPDDYLELINPLWSTRELKGKVERIEPENVDEGTVSPYLVRRGRPGTIVSLGGVQGEFVLPDEIPEKLLFISAGSGITPIMSMLRSLSHQDEVNDVVLLHSARTEDEIIFGDQLRELEEKHEGFRFHRQLTGEMGRM